MNAITRPFQINDLNACTDLFINTFSQPPWNENWDREIAYSRLSQIFENSFAFGLIAEAESILGFAMGFCEPWQHGKHFYLKEMCVHPDFQRQGIGSKLLTSLLANLKEQNVQRIYLLTARGDLSENFYSKMGFYTSDKSILMARKLS